MAHELERWLPRGVRRGVRIVRHQAALREVPAVPADASRLLSAARLPAALLGGPEVEAGWERLVARLEALDGVQRASGLRQGERRALYHLVRGLGARSALEVGTHIGASTACLAAALADHMDLDAASDATRAGVDARHGAVPAPGRSGLGPRLVTVDVEPVNDPVLKPWVRYGGRRSPRALVEALGLEALVDFVGADSRAHLAADQRRYDLIFLDGDPAAGVVYEELARALGCLNPGGVVVLHDLHPGLKPLWPGAEVLPGPWLACRRLQREGVPLVLHPLGPLPWETRPGVRQTSLALVLGS